MSIVFQGANVVVLARQGFSSAIFSQAWLIEHLGIAPNAFEEGAIQTPFVFATQTRQFNLIVIPERVQLNLPADRDAGSEREGEMVRRIMHAVLKHIPQLSTQGAGLNFNWAVNGNGHPNSETTRRLFFAADKPLFRLFGDAPDACFGAYASKDFRGVRLRVDAKPNTQPNEANATQTLFNFNFNVDTPSDGDLRPLEQLLTLWDDAREEASRIMNLISEECGV